MQLTSTMKSSIWRTVSAGMLMLFLWSGVLAPSNRVFCEGENGHRQVEYANAGCCDGQSHLQAPPFNILINEPWAIAGQPQCGRCVDTPLVSTSSTILPRTRAAVPDSGFQVCSYSMRCPDNASALTSTLLKCHVVFGSAPPHSPLQSLRTVVLLV